MTTIIDGPADTPTAADLADLYRHVAELQLSDDSADRLAAACLISDFDLDTVEVELIKAELEQGFL